MSGGSTLRDASVRSGRWAASGWKMDLRVQRRCQYSLISQMASRFSLEQAFSVAGL
jgi:hypothetical protein